jgi:predicted DNA-binding protein (MmcQ/YjbR family)
MTPDKLRDYLLSFAAAEETFPFNPETSVFKVGGKMFALSRFGEESLRVSVKCEPRLAEALREAHAAVIPGYHLNKRHWNTVILDGSLSDGAVKEMIEDSYDLVVSKLPKAKRSAPGRVAIRGVNRSAVIDHNLGLPGTTRPNGPLPDRDDQADDAGDHQDQADRP